MLSTRARKVQGEGAGEGDMGQIVDEADAVLYGGGDQERARRGEEGEGVG